VDSTAKPPIVPELSPIVRPASGNGAWGRGPVARGAHTSALLQWKQVRGPASSVLQGVAAASAASDFLQAVAITPTGGALAVGSAHGGTGAIFLE